LQSWTETEQATSKKQKVDELRAQYEEEANPTRASFHKFILFVKVVAGLCALLMLTGQVVGMIFQEISLIQYVLRVYIIALCVLAIFVEMEWTAFARDSKVLQFWITRGLFYVFIGVIGLEENNSTHGAKNTTVKGSALSHEYTVVVAWTMVGLGVVYFAFGICCCQVYYNRVRNEYEDRVGTAPLVRQTAERYSDV
jgi:hypothetical protein